jgi:hypothetical protein
VFWLLSVVVLGLFLWLEILLLPLSSSDPESL